MESAMLNGVAGMIGETAVVTKTVSDRHQPGSVLTRGEVWFAVSSSPTRPSTPEPPLWWPTSIAACSSSIPPTELGPLSTRFGLRLDRATRCVQWG